MKKILSLLTILLLTGCSVNYDIKIDGNKLEEEIKITESINNFNESISDQQVENSYSEFSSDKKEKYKTSKNKQDDFVTYTLNQKYTISERMYIRAFSECFDTYKVSVEGKNYVIKTGQEFKCLSYGYNKIDNVNVNISIAQPVIESNADSVSNNIYTWTFDNNSPEDKYIYIKFKKIDINENKKTNIIDTIKNNMKLPFDSDILIVIVSLIIIVILVLLFILVGIRINKKNNKL